MQEDRHKKLDDIGFIWDQSEFNWLTGYDHLTDYKEIHGHCEVKNNELIKQFQIGFWCSNQRKLKSELSPERLRLLNDIGFIWDMNQYFWSKGFGYLKQYYAENHHTVVPTNHKVEGYNLGGWVSHQRKRYRNNAIPQEEIDQLSDLEFVWNKLTAQWEFGFQKLQKYYSIHANSEVKQLEVFDNFKLGFWVGVQRRNRNNLEQEKINKLDSVHFIWDVREYWWNKSYAELKIYFKNNGNFLVPQRYEVNSIKLGKWVSSQRSRKIPLSNKKIKLLDKIGFTW